MRLPCWFAAGACLSDVAGFEVTSMQLGTLWSLTDTDHVLDEPPTILHDTVVDTGADLAIAMDPSPDARAYLQRFPPSAATSRCPSGRVRAAG
jgi:hypothetical protein